MPFIGNKPSAVPLTSADITDNVITSAKIVDGTITNTDIASSIITGQTAETSIAGGDSILIYDDSATALRKMTRTNFVAGIGGTNTPAFKAYRNGDVSISDLTWTKIQFNTEVYDTNSNYDNATNYRFTPTTAGKYFFVATVFFGGSSADLKQAVIRIEKNGTEASRYAIDRRTSGIGYNCSVMTSATLEANGSSDYFEAHCFRDAGGSVNIIGDSASTYFQAFKLIE